MISRPPTGWPAQLKESYAIVGWAIERRIYLRQHSAWPAVRPIWKCGALCRMRSCEENFAIFPESALNPKLERAIARDAGAKVGGALWADALGPPGSSGDTYLKAMAANTRTIVSGLSRGRETCAQLSP